MLGIELHYDYADSSWNIAYKYVFNILKDCE